jgi:hypothetical protein
MQAMRQEAFFRTLNGEQIVAIGALRSEIQPRFLALMSGAQPLQEKLRSAITDKNQPVDDRELQRLAELRLEMTRVIASAYSRLRAILGDEQWQQLLRTLQKD